MNISGLINKYKKEVLLGCFLAIVIFAITYVILIYIGELTDSHTTDNTINSILMFAIPATLLLMANKFFFVLKLSFWYLLFLGILLILSVFGGTGNETLSEKLSFGLYIGAVWFIFVFLYFLLNKGKLLFKKGEDKDQTKVVSVKFSIIAKYGSYALFILGLWLLFSILYGLVLKLAYGSDMYGTDFEVSATLIIVAIILLGISSAGIYFKKHKFHLPRLFYVALMFILIFEFNNQYQTNKNWQYPQPDKILTIKAGTNIRECSRVDCKITGHYPKPTRSFFPADFDTSSDWIELNIWTDNTRTATRKGYVTRGSFIELSSNVNNPTKTVSNTTAKPKLPQKLSVPTPTNASSGPPITLYTKTDVNIYKSASDISEIIGQAQQYGYWEFPYTPTGDWYSVLTIDSKPGFVKAIDLTSEKPTSPAHCSLKYTYNLTRVDGFWKQKGYDEAKLLDFIKYSEKQWEDASGKDLFQYDPNSDNKIDFIVDDYFKVDPKQDEYGLYIGKSYANGTTAENYNIIMFSRIFEYSGRRSTTNYGGYMTKEQMDDYIIVATIIHELGHAIGISHLEQESAIMYKSANFPSTESPKLTDFDKDALTSWCSGN